MMVFTIFSCFFKKKIYKKLLLGSMKSLTNSEILPGTGTRLWS